jgi:hypothetical protein
MKIDLCRRLPLILLASSFPLIAFADTAYVAKADGDIEIGCVCAAGFPGCETTLFDALNSKQRITWTQKASMLAGKTYNLDQLCYRKRDEDGMGGGLCCKGAGEEDSIKRLFRGKAKD